jgi:hypothetical protein
MLNCQRLEPTGDHAMAPKTCAACDCALDEKSIKIKLRGKTVEVCCEDCARRLKEADAAARESGSED